MRLKGLERQQQMLILKTGIWPALLCCFIMGLLAGPYPVAAQILELKKESLFEDNTGTAWELEADELIYDHQLDEYIARGDVQIFKDDKKLTADFIRYNHKTQRAFARGNVVLTVGQDVLTGSQLDINLENQVGSIENAYLFLKENNFHITANRIEKTGEKTYRIDKASLTSCDGPAPSWKITAKDIKIKEDGYGSAKHAVFWVRKLPVFYTPYFSYPARKDRQSGFLDPELGKTERKGYLYSQPFFWAISESADATFYANYMSKRGIRPGAEYRYFLNENSKGTFMMDGFDDQKTDEGGESSKDYGYPDAGEDVLRTNHNRYWFRMSHHQPIPLGFFAKLDLDIASDQDYLRDFREGYMGYDDTNEYFLKAFHRQLNDYNDPVRTNRLNLNRLWPKFSFNFEPRWNDDTRQDDNTSETLQRLPFMSFDGEKQKIMTSPLYFDFGSQYDYFWRDSGTRGQRLDAHPRFYLPMRAGKYATVEPSVGLRGTGYRLDQRNFDDQPDTHQWSHRELLDTRLDLLTEIDRVFNLEGGLFEKIRHRIRPQVTHEFITHTNQTDLPRFDAIDRIPETNQITYSLTNTLTSKSGPANAKKPGSDLPERRGEGSQTPINYTYNDFFRLKIENSYDFERSGRSFSPVFTRLDVTPLRYINLYADAQYSVYESKFLGHNLRTFLWDKRGDKIYVDYRYEKANMETDNEQNINSIYGYTWLNLTESLSVNGDWSYNFETKERNQTSAGFTYQSQCWLFDFKYTDKPHDWAVSFKIELTGLGEYHY